MCQIRYCRWGGSKNLCTVWGSQNQDWEPPGLDWFLEINMWYLLLTLKAAWWGLMGWNQPVHTEALAIWLAVVREHPWTEVIARSDRPAPRILVGRKNTQSETLTCSQMIQSLAMATKNSKHRALRLWGSGDFPVTGNGEVLEVVYCGQQNVKYSTRKQLLSQLSLFTKSYIVTFNSVGSTGNDGLFWKPPTVFWQQLWTTIHVE